MAVAVKAPLVVVTSSAVPDCCAEACAYRPGRIALILRMMDELAHSGVEPSDGLLSAMAAESRPHNGIPSDEPFFRDRQPPGPADQTGAQIVADIHRAIKAGKRSPLAIAEYLCPFAVDQM